MSQRKPLQTLGDVLRRDYKRRWRARNAEKVRGYYQTAKVREWEREQAAKQGALL